MARLAVYAIALNEVRHVARFLQACVGADIIVVADTGSTDGTLGALRHGGAVTHAITVRPWRFDDARNAALALVPADVDICLALDLDEVLAPGWRGAVERGWTPETTLGRYRYVTSHLPDGAPAVELSGAKIHCRFGYRWRHMCHEVLVADRLAHPQETWLPDLRVDHWPDSGKSRGHYLGLLEAAVAEAPDDLRDRFLLGREYVWLGRWDDGELVLRRYLTAAGGRWPPRRAAAWRLLARCYTARGDAGQAVACLHEGLTVSPEMRDLWLDLADCHAGSAEWQACFAAAQRGLALPISPGAIANDGRHAGGRPFYHASLAAWRLGRLVDAHALAIEAHSREPGHPVYGQHLDAFGMA